MNQSEVAPDSAKIERAIADFSASLRKDIISDMKHAFRWDCYIIGGNSSGINHNLTIKSPVIYEVCRSTQQAMGDLRNVYPGTVTTVKYISNVCFWIVKLKPINENMMVRNGDVRLDLWINEKIALSWGIRKLLIAVQTDNLRELIPKEELRQFIKITDHYIDENMFTSVSNGSPIDTSDKFTETVHNTRYKKTTSINFYEMFMHLIVAHQAQSS